MEAFSWCLSVLMCILGALRGIGGCLEGGVGAFGCDGIVLNYVLGALGGLRDVSEVFWGCWERFNWWWGF